MGNRESSYHNQGKKNSLRLLSINCSFDLLECINCLVLSYNDFIDDLKLINMRQKNYSPTGFTLSDNDRAILKREMMRTGKTRSEIIREYIADIGRKQAKQNKAA